MTQLTIEKDVKFHRNNFATLDDLFWYCVTNNLLMKKATPDQEFRDPILSAGKDARNSSEVFASVDDLFDDLMN